MCTSWRETPCPSPPGPRRPRSRAICVLAVVLLLSLPSTVHGSLPTNVEPEPVEPTPFQDGPSADACSWPTFQADPARTGSCRFASVDGLGEPRVLLETSNPIQTPIAYGDGRILVPTTEALEVLPTDPEQPSLRFATIEASSGDNRLTAGRAPTTGAAVADGAAYVASRDATAHRVDLRPGAIDWRTSLAGPVNVTPVLAQERVVFVTADGAVQALDTETGEEDWSADLPADVLADPVLAGGKIIVATVPGTVHAFELASGQPAWTVPLGPVATAVGGGVWTDRVVTAPAASDGTVYVATDAARLSALDADTGRTIWVREVSETEFTWTSPTVADGKVVIATVNEPRLVAVDAATGEPAWERRTGERVHVSPVAVDDTLLVSTLSGELLAVDPGTGDVLHHRNATPEDPSALQSPAAVVSGSLVFGTDDGRVLAVPLSPPPTGNGTDGATRTGIRSVATPGAWAALVVVLTGALAAAGHRAYRT
jgi:outer membrane protein assembly factor BamB